MVDAWKRGTEWLAVVTVREANRNSSDRMKAVDFNKRLMIIGDKSST